MNPPPTPPTGAVGNLIQQSETAFTLLVQGVLDYGIFMLDAGGHIVSWNAGAARIKGYRAEEITGKHFSIFYPPEDIATRKPQRELEIAIAEGRLEDEGWRLRKDGSRFWANVVITALFDDDGVLRGFGKVTRDMTERRNAELALSQRRRLFGHLVRAQELERRRIAWAVHDDSIQTMAAVGVRLQLLAEQLPPVHAAELAQLNASVTDAVTRLRTLSFRLHPPGIDQHGLAESVAGHLEDVVHPWGLTSSFSYRVVREPTSETAVTIFRIIQEALLNVRKHADAQRVELHIASADDGLLTQVIDDGNGKAIAPHAVHEHLGIMEMRERAETAGGWWSMNSRPESGTTVEFWVPNPPALPPGDAA